MAHFPWYSFVRLLLLLLFLRLVLHSLNHFYFNNYGIIRALCYLTWCVPIISLLCVFVCSLFYLLLFWPLIPNHCIWQGLLLNLITLNDTRTHTHARAHTHTLGRTLLNEESARRRELYLKPRNTPKRHTSMHSAGFEPAIPGSQRPKTHALGRTATEWACSLLMYVLNLIFTVVFEIGPWL
jgi:hypothetical protein